MKESESVRIKRNGTIQSWIPAEIVKLTRGSIVASGRQGREEQKLPLGNEKRMYECVWPRDGEIGIDILSTFNCPVYHHLLHQHGQQNLHLQTNFCLSAINYTSLGAHWQYHFQEYCVNSCAPFSSEFPIASLIDPDNPLLCSFFLILTNYLNCIKMEHSS